MKKPLIIFLSIFSLATIALISTSHANMFNRLKKGFYFEKYSTAEEAKAELLRLHPIGSDVGELVKTLEGAGCVVKEENLDSYYNYKKFKKREEWWDKDMVAIYDIKYEKASPFFVILNYLIWSGTVQINKDGKILDVGIHRGRAY